MHPLLPQGSREFSTPPVNLRHRRIERMRANRYSNQIISPSAGGRTQLEDIPGSPAPVASGRPLQSHSRRGSLMPGGGTAPSSRSESPILGAFGQKPGDKTSTTRRCWRFCCECIHCTTSTRSDDQSSSDPHSLLIDEPIQLSTKSSSSCI